MQKKSTLLLAVAIAIAVAVGAWLVRWSPTQPSMEERLIVGVESIQETPSVEPRLDGAGLANEDAIELDTLESEAIERAELATAAESPSSEPAGPSAPVRGTLRDERTGEPLPHFLLRLHDRTHREDVSTDANGRFESSTAFLAGTLRVDPIDHPTRRNRAATFEIEHELVDGEARDQEWSVASGPTFFLVLDPEEHVELVPPAGTDAAADPLAKKLRAQDARLSLAVLGEEVRDRVGSEAIRPPSSDDARALPWVRFGPIATEFDRAERLELRSTEGLWRANAPVKAISGVQLAPVTLKLEARAALAGRVVDEVGLPVARALVVLREEPDTPGDRQRQTTTDGEGRYRFEYARPVPCRVTARSLRHEERVEDVTLVAREVTRKDLVLTTLPPAGPIRGEIVTETGRSTPKARVRLAIGNGRGSPTLETDVAWTTQDGRKVGRFGFEALPAGKFTLSVQKDDWLKWEPMRTDVSPPREDVRVLVRDDVSLCDYVVRVRDLDNGLPLEGLRLWLEFQNGPNHERRPVWNEPFERGVPIERAFRWRIDFPGYGSERGDEKAFALEEHRDGRIVRVLELALKPGWSDVVRAVRRDGRGPIEGVEILVDGEVMGKTGKDGQLRLDLRDPPKTIEAKHASWRLAGRADLRPAWRREDRKSVLLRFIPVQRRRQ